MDIEKEFDQAMFKIYRRAKEEAGYNAVRFFQMLYKKRGVQTAKDLINPDSPSDGYTALWEKGRLDLTVEAMVVENEKWHELFTDDEIEKAKERLKEYKYKPKT